MTNSLYSCAETEYKPLNHSKHTMFSISYVFSQKIDFLSTIDAILSIVYSFYSKMFYQLTEYNLEIFLLSKKRI